LDFLIGVPGACPIVELAEFTCGWDVIAQRPARLVAELERRVHVRQLDLERSVYYHSRRGLPNPEPRTPNPEP
jgi:hypothetical protein